MPDLSVSDGQYNNYKAGAQISDLSDTVKRVKSCHRQASLSNQASLSSSLGLH